MNFPFFRRILTFAKTGPAISDRDSRLSAGSVDRRLVKTNDHLPFKTANSAISPVVIHHHNNQ
jgi:hypothetical protein